MPQSTLILYWFVLLLLSAFFSAMEMAFISSGKLQYLMSKRKKSVINFMLDHVYNNYRRFLFSLSLGNLTVLVLFYYVSFEMVNSLFRDSLPQNELLVTVLIIIAVSLVLIISGEIIPRVITTRNPDGWIKALIAPSFIFYIIAYPLVQLFQLTSNGLLSLFRVRMMNQSSHEPLAQIELDELIRKSIDDISDEDEIESEVKILRNALDFSSMRIRDCMVPRAEIVAINEDADINKLKDLFIETGISRILVYKEDIDNIIGYIHVWEMFNNPGDWTKCIAELSFVPESMPANKLMNELMQQHKSIAVVIDEFGGTSGVITIEDLVEEIFGEIEDEYDSQAKFVKKESDSEFVMSGRVEIDTLNEEFGLDLPESEDYSTVAGFLLNYTQRFPKTYETIVIGRFVFKILKVTSRKIEVVKLEIIEEE